MDNKVSENELKRIVEETRKFIASTSITESNEAQLASLLKHIMNDSQVKDLIKNLKIISDSYRMMKAVSALPVNAKNLNLYKSNMAAFNIIYDKQVKIMLQSILSPLQAELNKSKDHVKAGNVLGLFDAMERTMLPELKAKSINDYREKIDKATKQLTVQKRAIEQATRCLNYTQDMSILTSPKRLAQLIKISQDPAELAALRSLFSSLKKMDKDELKAYGTKLNALSKMVKEGGAAQYISAQEYSEKTVRAEVKQISKTKLPDEVKGLRGIAVDTLMAEVGNLSALAALVEKLSSIQESHRSQIIQSTLELTVHGDEANNTKRGSALSPSQVAKNIDIREEIREKVIGIEKSGRDTVAAIDRHILDLKKIKNSAPELAEKIDQLIFNFEEDKRMLIEQRQKIVDLKSLLIELSIWDLKYSNDAIRRLIGSKKETILQLIQSIQDKDPVREKALRTRLGELNQQIGIETALSIKLNTESNHHLNGMPAGKRKETIQGMLNNQNEQFSSLFLYNSQLNALVSQIDDTLRYVLSNLTNVSSGLTSRSLSEVAETEKQLAALNAIYAVAIRVLNKKESDNRTIVEKNRDKQLFESIRTSSPRPFVEKLMSVVATLRELEFQSFNNHHKESIHK